MSKLYNHIKSVAARFPHSMAVKGPLTVFTYEQFIQLADQISGRLQQLVPKKSRVYISANNSPQFLALILALVKEEENFFLIDPRSSEEELQQGLKDIPANYLIADKDLWPSFDFLDDVAGLGFCKLSDSRLSSLAAKLYFFSSGSTGVPKAFGFSDEQLFSMFGNFAETAKFVSNDRSLVPLTITHSHGLMLSIPMLMSGGCVHLIPPKTPEPGWLLTYIGENNITVLTGVPYQYNQLLQATSEKPGELRSLRYAFCGSAPMSEYLAASFEEKFGIQLNQAYGVSEIGPICVNMERNHNFQSVGKVLPYIEYKIVGDDGQLAREGELVVRSSFMSDEYLNAPAESAETFKNGWIYTQDIVREDEEGYIYIAGRRKNFINVSGYKIYPVEVEKVLLSMKGIKDAAVFGVADEARGQIIEAVVSTFFPLPEEEIISFCKKHLAAYKIPHRIVIEKELQHASIHKVSYTRYTSDK